jgi:hypothetical protein
MMMVEARRRNPVTLLTMEVPMRRSPQLCRFSKKELIVMGRRIVVPRREVPYCCEKSCTKANGKEVGTQILRKG